MFSFTNNNYLGRKYAVRQVGVSASSQPLGDTQKEIMMKLTIILLFSFTLGFSQQNINRDNYYTFFKDYEDYRKLGVKDLTTSHLSEFTIAQILYSEMKKAGFEWLNNYRIINVQDDKYIISICYSEKQKVGFVFEGSFAMIPEESTKNFKSMSRKDGDYDCSEKIILNDGKSQFVKIENMPTNLFIIKHDLYWFQSTENEEVNKKLVSKEIITEIFKQDIRDVLANFKNERSPNTR